MKILVCLIFLMAGCGSDPSYRDNKPTPGPGTPGPSPSRPVTFAQVKPIIDEQCAVSGCHAGAAFTQNGAAFKNSTSRQRINSGNMPKKSGRNYPIYNSAKKAILLDYLTN